jgi:two-component system cell cycle response regulator
MKEGSPTILVIDPVEIDRSRIRAQIETQFQVKEGCCLEELRRFISQDSIDLLILYDQLIDGNAIEFLGWLRRDSKHASLPVIVISSCDDESVIVDTLDAGANDFIRKPVTAFEIKARVALAMRGREATEQVEGLIEELKERSERDALTDVFNRFGFQRHAIKEVAKAKRSNTFLSLLMMDIDRFKLINDEHGHLVGDEVLLGFTQILSANLRKYDLISRFGGDEFVVILPHTGKNEAALVAKKILDHLGKQPQLTKKGSVPVTTSIGVVTFHPDPESADSCDTSTLEELLVRADQALYQAKEQGRNRAVIAQSEVGGVL